MRLIDADVLVKLVEDSTTEAEWLVSQYNADWICSMLESAPTIDAEPVKHGRWKGEGMGDYSCSLCTEIVSGNTYNYCPYCGTRMEGTREK